MSILIWQPSWSFVRLKMPLWRGSQKSDRKSESTFRGKHLNRFGWLSNRNSGRCNNLGHKKVQKNSVFSRFHSKVLPLALSRCLYRGDTNASEENGVADLLSKGLLCICVHRVFEIDLPLAFRWIFSISSLLRYDIISGK